MPVPHAVVPMHRLRVATSGRGLVKENGDPFFWLGDTAWELFHRLTREEVEFYFDNRARKEFSVIQAVILPELDGLRSPNMYGDLPFQNENPAMISEAYFDHVDWVTEHASLHGLYMALLPTWGDKVEKKYDWAMGPEIFTLDNARAFGYFLGNRYRNSSNIIWILGGDRDPSPDAVEIWREMARGIIIGSGGKSNTLMSFHPQPLDGGSSSRWFHNDDWLDFNMLQTGHDKYKNTFDQVGNEYRLNPVKPVIDGEPTYEAHGLGFLPFKNGYSTAAEVRKFAYWSVFSGAFGHTYGCHSVWQFYTRQRDGINYPLYDWKDALDLSGARQMTYLKRLMTSIRFTDCIPDQSLIADNYPKGDDYCCATRDAHGSCAFIYSPTGKPFHIRTRSLPGEGLQYRWFNPSDGISTVGSIIKKAPFLRFQPPTWGDGNDWVLVIGSHE